MRLGRLILLACLLGILLGGWRAVALAQIGPAPPHSETAPKPAGAASADDVMRHQPKLPDARQTAEELRSILAQPEYAENEQQTRGQSMSDRLLNWLSTILERFQGFLRNFGISTSGPLNAIVLILLAALVAYVISRLLWELFAKRRAVELTNGVALPENSSAAALLEAAKKALAVGDVRLALRLRFMALLRELDIAPVARLTNWQLARRLKREWPAAGEPFSALVLCYEDAWYGGLPCAAADYSRADELAQSVRAAVKLGEAEEARP